MPDPLPVPLPVPAMVPLPNSVEERPVCWHGGAQARRRQWLAQAGGLLLALRLQPVAAQAPSGATGGSGGAGAAGAPGVPTLAERIAQWAGGRPVATGRITLQVPELVENGNAVPLSVWVQSSMRGADRVEEILLLNERNPQREVARFAFGPASPRAQVSTRIRLATSQRLVALARLADGSLWQQPVDVLVTLAACVET